MGDSMTRAPRYIGLGVLVAGSTMLLAALVILVTGPLFGVWGWREVALVALLAEALGLGLLALRGSDEPALRRWDAHADPQARFPMMGARPGPQPTGLEARYLWMAAPVAAAAVALIVDLAIG